MSQRIAVVGAGVGGCSTAYNILRLVPNASVTIFADKFTSETTSHGAAGMLLPSLIGHGKPEHVILRWAMTGKAHFKSIYDSEEAASAGIQLVTGYSCYKEKPYNPVLEKFAPRFEKITPESQGLSSVLRRYDHCYHIQTFMVEGRRYLPFLMKKIESAGGKFVRQKILSRSEVESKFDVVFYCCGLGAEKLLGDKEMMPSRGYVIRAEAPWIKHFLYCANKPKTKSLYVFPGIENVVLGGYYQDGDVAQGSANVRADERSMLWKAALDALPSLAAAKQVEEWVGFRPRRSSYRIECENVPQPNGKITKVVYNYGFGTNGMSLSFGASVEAVGLAFRHASVANSKL